jgi:PKD repeat protein
MKKALVFFFFAVSLGCGRPVDGAGNLSPVADAGGDQVAVLNMPLTLDGSGSTDPDGEIVSFEWQIGTVTLEGQKVEHTFTESGSFVVRLKVQDDNAATATDEIVVTVGGGEPQPHMEISRQPATLFEVLTFDASGSVVQGMPTAFEWSFGDGNTGSGEVTTHAYDQPGTFTVTLTITDDQDRVGTATTTLEIGPLDISGVFYLTADPETYACSSYDAVLGYSQIHFSLDEDGETLTATSGGDHPWEGTLDGVDFEIQTSDLTNTGSSCPDAPVTTTITGTFLDINTLTANAVRYFDLSVPCQCSALFSVSGTRP